MAWYGLVDDATGALKGIGSEAMFPGGDINAVPDGMVRVDFGDTQPDLAAQRWNETTREFEARPAPVLFDRADELRARIRAAFEADSQFMTAFMSMNGANRTLLRTRMDAVLTAEFRTLLGARRWRDQSEPADGEL